MATQQQVNHYEALAAQAQRSLPDSFDNWLNADNPHENDDHDDPPTEEDAERQVMQSGYELAWELGELVHDAGCTDTVDVAALCRGGYDPGDKPLHELLAVVVNAYEADDVKAAAYELRLRLRAALAPRINDVYGDMCTQHMAEQHTGADDGED